MITTKRTTSTDPDFRWLVVELDKDLRIRYQELQDIYDQHNKVTDLHTVVVAYDNGVPVGCGCFKPFNEESVEIKRMFVVPAKRGTGISTAVLTALHNWAKEMNYQYSILETGRQQPEAIRFYTREGYVVTENYGQYIGMAASVCMKRML